MVPWLNRIEYADIVKKKVVFNQTHRFLEFFQSIFWHWWIPVTEIDQQYRLTSEIWFVSILLHRICLFLLFDSRISISIWWITAIAISSSPIVSCEFFDELSNSALSSFIVLLNAFFSKLNQTKHAESEQEEVDAFEINLPLTVAHRTERRPDC